MPRGPQESDARLFAEKVVPTLRSAAADLAWLLGRGYAMNSALKLVGDRHELRARQRVAVRRATCSAEQCERRRARAMGIDEIAGTPLAIDGFNVLISVEAALAGGAILRCMDGSTRDMASVHGSYRRADTTAQALGALATVLSRARPERVIWYFDRPVSNSGRLAGMLRELAEERGLDWTVELVSDPDRLLHRFDGVVASSDAWVLDYCRAWVDLAAAAIDEAASDVWRLDLEVEPSAGA